MQAMHAYSRVTRWRTPVVVDDTAFEALKAGLDLLGSGDKLMWNSGMVDLLLQMHKVHLNFAVSAEFYGVNPPTANLELLSRFFAKYPGYEDRVFLSVKVRYNLICPLVTSTLPVDLGWHRQYEARLQS